MDVRYSSYSKDKLLHFLKDGMHLVDFDEPIVLAENIRRALSALERETETCIAAIDSRINALRGEINRASSAIADAEQAIRNTPTTTVVYPSKEAAARGAKPVEKEINRDVIERYNERISTLSVQIDRAQNIIITLEEDRGVLSEELFTLREHIRSAEDAVNVLTEQKKNAAKATLHYQDTIEYAAECIDNYRAVRVIETGERVISHIKPKEGW